MNLAQHFLAAAIRVYQLTLSPATRFVFGPTAGCRFEPSCSAYAAEAIRLHGAARGAWLACKRICRCHPWGGCGHDPVPLSGRAEGNRDGAHLFTSHQRSVL